jgi:hypothetical protein
VGTTEVTLEWVYNGSRNQPNSFRVNCLPSSHPAINVSRIITVLEEVDNTTTISNFTDSITGLEEYTNYTCSITARNIFGDGPNSDVIDIMTNPAGKMNVATWQVGKLTPLHS